MFTIVTYYKYISASPLNQSQKDPAAVDQMMECLDTNSDGQMDFEEFVCWWRRIEETKKQFSICKDFVLSNKYTDWISNLVRLAVITCVYVVWASFQ